MERPTAACEVDNGELADFALLVVACLSTPPVISCPHTLMPFFFFQVHQFCRGRHHHPRPRPESPHQ
jgi:hypothetical protein